MIGSMDAGQIESRVDRSLQYLEEMKGRIKETQGQARYEGLDWSQGRRALPTPVNSQMGGELLEKELLDQQYPNSLSQSCVNSKG